MYILIPYSAIPKLQMYYFQTLNMLVPTHFNVKQIKQNTQLHILKCFTE